MKIGRVRSTVVATVHHRALEGRRLLLCQLLDEHRRATDGYTIAVDTVGAGAGEVVLILDEGSSARLMLGDADAPIRAVVAGIVDQVTIDTPQS